MKGGDEHGDTAAPAAAPAPAKKPKRKMNAYMQARVELSGLIRKKEGIPGGKDGMKKLAEIINKVMEKAGVANYKETGMPAAEAMQKALKYYKTN